MKCRNAAFFILCFSCFVSCYRSEQADLVIHNAYIITVDPQDSQVEAMAIKDGKIIALGAEREILNRYQAAETIDARKKIIYPGFIDAHAHFLGYATNKGELSLHGVQSQAELIARVEKFAASSAREWIVGRGWDQNKWPEKTFPSKEVLDSLFPNRPVALQRIDGHVMLVNAEAMRRSKLDEHTKIIGGSIALDQYGKPTGILFDEACNAVKAAIEPMERSQLINQLIEAEMDCYASGLTMVSDMGLSLTKIDFLDSLYNSKIVQIPIYALYQPEVGVIQRMESGPVRRENFVIRGVKLYADGALGSRGALLKSPYSDKPDSRGIKILSDSIFELYSNTCMEYGFQLCVHAIGDSANAIVLEKMSAKLEEMNDRRWRVEHAQVVSPEDWQYFRDYAIIPSMQPIHATSDMHWVSDRLGNDRIKHAYALKSLKELMGILPFGTDFPVENISPIANYYAAVFRKDKSGQPIDGYEISEALTREEALKGLTIWAAIACFEEDRRGSLEIGKQADFIITDRNILTCPADDVLKTKVISTYSGGKLVYPAK